jgi:hypothetical protein
MPFAQLVRHDAHQVRRLPSSVPGPRDDGLQVVGKQAFGSTARAGRSRLVCHPCRRRRKGAPVVVSQGAQGCCKVERGPLLNRPRVARRVPGAWCACAPSPSSDAAVDSPCPPLRSLPVEFWSAPLGQGNMIRSVRLMVTGPYPGRDCYPAQAHPTRATRINCHAIHASE